MKEIMVPAKNETLRPVVAIIGGGFAGGGVAWHLASALSATGLRIVVFEPRDKLGTGLAYDTIDPVHRINVPATKMSLDPSRPEHFVEWVGANNAVAGDLDVYAADGQLFPRRQVFGKYVNAQIQPFVDSGRIEHRRQKVVKVGRDADGWRIDSETGDVLRADIVVIATSHPAPSAPPALASILEGHPRFVPDATVANALKPIRENDSVLLVGNGLTSADVIASLIAQGHKGPITAISRRGLRSRGHAPKVQEQHGDFTTRPIPSARLLTRRIRQAIKEAAIFDVSWHAVLDAVRAQAFNIWQNLPVSERRRVVRHLRPFWDVHRFRIAPQVESALDAAIARGQLQILAASVAAVSYHDGRVRSALRRAHGAGTVIRDFDAVVVTTGPAHGGILDSQPFLSGLKADGVIHSDPARLGIACDTRSCALDSADHPVDGLYIAGPLARGTFGELMGLPQVSEHAASVAREVIARIAQQSATLDLASDAA
jgi:uncharacterized NAD(P)/FAD-binding protein YdhS